MKIFFTLTVSFLMLFVTFSPIIIGDEVEIIDTKSKNYAFSLEFVGSNEEKRDILLNKEDALKLENIIGNFEGDIKEASSLDDTNKIFNEFLLDIKEYDLLKSDFNKKSYIEKLPISNIKKKILKTDNDPLKEKDNESRNILKNLLCFIIISGELNWYNKYPRCVDGSIPFIIVFLFLNTIICSVINLTLFMFFVNL